MEKFKGSGSLPRLLLTAGASGSGKTLITCGLLKVLTERGLEVASFKCGPDYIDPMFHTQVIGTRSANLDTFFTSPEKTRQILARNAQDCQIAILEGVMGYYDGLGGISTRASAYDLASVTETPAILLVNARGASLSLAAFVQGFVRFREESHIKGIIFNQASPMLYPRLKDLVEQETGVKALGYVPKVEDCAIDSRHLGLVLPQEVPDFQEKLHRLAQILEESLDMDALLALAETAQDLRIEDPTRIQSVQKEEISRKTGVSQKIEVSPAARPAGSENQSAAGCIEGRVRIGLAKDEAFCFLYKDNLRLLEDLGADLIPFSPLSDPALPDHLDGLLLYGGYPELHAKTLSENTSMRTQIRQALEAGLPCMAECGGFMYLFSEMEDTEGNRYPMCGFLPGRAFHTHRLTRFGYVTLQCLHKAFGEDLGSLPAHEFHYFDTEDPGEAFEAVKPLSSRKWLCMHARADLLAGFPHLYYEGAPQVATAFLRRCAHYRDSGFGRRS